ncbi:MAG: DUF4349 domain-containing protein [Caldisericia bacterium]|nr:DUF4349 domain-containing protein [Caldisericia bacterium]
MRKLFNKRASIIFIIILIIIVGLILSSVFLSKLLPFFGTMRKNSTIPEYGINNESLMQTKSTEENAQYKTQTTYYETGLKLIKKGNANIEVEKGKFYETLNKVILLANQFSGSLINSQVYEEDEKNSGYLTFMIPSKNFNDFVNKLNEIGKMKNLSISTQDVSEEYFDLEGRIKILESQRTLLLSWLEKAKEIKDLLSIRTELQNIETEIERIKGRMNYINYHSEYSEISIMITEKEEVVPFWKKSEILKRVIEGLIFALKSIINSIIFMIIFLAFILPWAFLTYLFYFLIKKYLLKKK